MTALVELRRLSAAYGKIPVIADASLSGDRERTISLGAGEHGVAATVNAEAALAHLEAQVADITELQES